MAQPDLQDMQALGKGIQSLLRRFGLFEDSVARAAVSEATNDAEAMAALKAVYPGIENKLAEKAGLGKDPTARAIAAEVSSPDEFDAKIAEFYSSKYNEPTEMPEETNFNTMKGFDFSKYKKAVPPPASGAPASTPSTAEADVLNRNLPVRLEDIPKINNSMQKFPSSKASEKTTIYLPETLVGLKQIAKGKFQQQPVEEINNAYRSNLGASKSHEEAAEKTIKQLKLPQSITPQDVLALTAAIGGSAAAVGGLTSSLFGDRNVNATPPAVKDATKFKGLPELKLGEDAKSYLAAAPKPAKEETASTSPATNIKPSAAPDKTHQQVAKVGKTLESNIANLDAPKEEKDPFATRLKALQDLEDSYWSEYKQSKNRLEFSQAMEMVGQAFAQLGAGLQGQRTGVDLSGLKFNKVDWEKKLDRTLEELRQGLQRTGSAKKAIADEQQFAQTMDFREKELKSKERRDREEAAARSKEASTKEAEKQAAIDEKLKERKLGALAALEQTIEQAEVENNAQRKNQLMQKIPQLAKEAGIAVGTPEKPTGFFSFLQSESYDKMKQQVNSAREQLSGGQAPARSASVQAYADQYFGGDYAKAEQFLRKRGDIK